MNHRIAFATAFAAAGLFASAAYAGSPYYDADGAMAAQPMVQSHVRAPAAHTGRVVSPRAAAQYKTGAATPTGAAPSFASDGYAAPATNSEAFDHAVGTDGSTVATEEPTAEPKAAPVYTAPLPKMDADGFQHAEGDKSFYEHAVGTDGSPVAADAAPTPKKADPVYTAAMPKMDADGFAHPESGSSFYNHAVGTDGAP